MSKLLDKNLGQYMTPTGIVNIILDSIGYFGEKTLTKRIIEPSFGDGSFLLEILERIIHYCQYKGIDEIKIKEYIEQNVFGIEIDSDLYAECIKKLNSLLEAYNIPSVDWNKNLYLGDTLLKFKDFINTFDFVVGNPPYIRIHNLDERTRDFIKNKNNFNFGDGTTDIYIAFYDLGLQMLKKDGRLGYISPNSFMKNTSQKKFRDFLINNKYIFKIFDFKNSKIFDGVDAYTCICILNKNKERILDNVLYREYNMYEIVLEQEFERNFFLDMLNEKAWNLSSYDDLKFLEENKAKPIKVKNIAIVQNGIATNRDHIFVHKVYDSDGNLWKGKHTDKKTTVYLDAPKEQGGIPIESRILHRCVKASKYAGIFKGEYIIFPYEKSNNVSLVDSNNLRYENNYKVIEEKKLKKDFPKCYDFLEKHYDELISRDLDKGAVWYQFGRSQGLLNSCFKKIVFKHIINKNKPEIQPFILDEDVIVYSGVYIVCDYLNIIQKLKTNTYQLNDFIYDKQLDELLNIFNSDDFSKYLTIVGKDMQGGYVAVSSKNIKDYGTNLTTFPNFPINVPSNDLLKADNNYLNKKFEDAFYNIILESYKKMGEWGTTSSERVKPFHSFLAEVLKFKLGSEFEVKAAGIGLDQEVNVKGSYNGKNVDICVLKKNIPIAAIEFKLLSNNFKQNLNNFKEGLLGEAAAMHNSGIKLAFCYLIPEKALYLTKDRKFNKLDVLTQNDLKSFYYLFDKNISTSPDALYVGIYKLFSDSFLNSLKADDYIDISSNDYLSSILSEKSDLSFVKDEDVFDKFKEQNIGIFLDDFIFSFTKKNK